MSTHENFTYVADWNYISRKQNYNCDITKLRYCETAISRNYDIVKLRNYKKKYYIAKMFYCEIVIFFSENIFYYMIDNNSVIISCHIYNIYHI